ncbi:MAG TPA: hypothetical protein VFN67_30960, partial [Polyangiales bacterium]|nr:hypothetical protein [Polyangiales bacterium]
MQGIDAYQAGDFATADRKLEKAYRVFATPTLALWSARARMQLGRWVEASERYREAARVSAAVGDSLTQQQAQTDADTELRVLLLCIPTLTIELQGSDEGTASLSLDGKPLSNELFGVRISLDP